MRDEVGMVGASDHAERGEVGCWSVGGCCVGEENERRIVIESAKWNERRDDGESEEAGRG